MISVLFPKATLSEYGRVDPTSGWIKFRCDLGSEKNIETLFRHFGWQIPGEKSSLEKLDGKLKGGHFILTANLTEEDRNKLQLRSPDRTFDMETVREIGFDECSGFECHRLEGRKKKGFRRQLRFQMKISKECTLAELESYQFATDNARASLKVVYIREAEQTNIELDPKDDAQGNLHDDARFSAPAN
jgi:hypothetical protein